MKDRTKLVGWLVGADPFGFRLSWCEDVCYVGSSCRIYPFGVVCPDCDLRFLKDETWEDETWEDETCIHGILHKM